MCALTVIGARFFYNRFSAPGVKKITPMHISSSRTARNKIPTTIPMFSTSGSPMVLLAITREWTQEILLISGGYCV